MTYYDWLAEFSEQHPGTCQIDKPFLGYNRRARRALGQRRGYAVSLLGAKRRGR